MKDIEHILQKVATLNTRLSQINSQIQTKLSSSPIPQEMAGKMSEVWQQFDDAVSQFESMQQGYIRAGQGLTRITGEMQDFSHHISEMGILEEKTQNIAEVGQNLVHRLTGKKDSE